MAMNKREKLLAAGVGAVVLLFVGQSIVSSFQDALAKKKEKLETGYIISENESKRTCGS